MTNIFTFHFRWGHTSPTRDQTCAPLHWKHGVLTTGPPGKSLEFLVFTPSCDNLLQQQKATNDRTPGGGRGGGQNLCLLQPHQGPWGPGDVPERAPDSPLIISGAIQ